MPETMDLSGSTENVARQTDNSSEISGKYRSSANLYQCGQCQRTFSRIDHLSRHVRTHTLEKPYPCLSCGKSFNRVDLLKRHGCRHTGGFQTISRVAEQMPEGQNRVSQACRACSESKLKCDEEKPCRRCSRKGIICLWTGMPDSPRPSDYTTPLNDTHIQVPRTLPFPQQSPIPPNNTGDVAMSLDHDPAHADENANENGRELPTTSTISCTTTGTAYDIYHAPIAPELFESSNEITDSTVMEYSDFLKDLLFYSPQEDVGDNDMQRVPNLWSSTIWDQYMTSDNDLNLSALANLETPLIGVETERVADEAYTAIPTSSIDAGEPVSPEQAAYVAGSKAFKRSMWHWIPSPQDFTAAAQSNLALSQDVLQRLYNFDVEASIFDKRFRPADRERILSVLLNFCEQSNILSIISNFPSPPLLERLMHRFILSQVSDTLSWFHVPTFDPASVRPELLMAIIACGASLAPVTAIQNLGTAITDILLSSITDLWHVNNTATRDMQLLQAYAMILHVRFWSGNKRQIEIGESLGQPLVTIVRRAGMLRRDQYTVIRPITDDEDSLLDQKWHFWVEQEAKIRYAHHIFVRDAQVSITQLINPLMSCSEMRIPLPASNDLWLAGSAVEWKARFLSLHSKVEEISSVRDCVRMVLQGEALTRTSSSAPMKLLTLYGIWGIIWEHSQMRNMLKSQNPFHDSDGVFSLTTRSELLERVLNIFHCNLSDTNLLNQQQGNNEVQFLFSFLSMALHVPLASLSSFAGKEGEDEAQRTYPSLQEWTQGKEARKGIWHSGQVLKYAKKLPAFRLRDFQVVAVFHSSLALWVYGIISAAHRQREGLSIDVRNTHLYPRRKMFRLDGCASPQQQKFFAIGDGVPGICRAADDLNDGDSVDITLLHDVSATMGISIDILRQKGEIMEEPPPAFTESVTQLMSELGRAAQAIGLGS